MASNTLQAMKHDEKQLREEVSNLCDELEKEINKGLQPTDYWSAKSALLSAKAAVLTDIHLKQAARRIGWLILLFIILIVFCIGSLGL